eukprot:7239096-Pyramimonas_sp.AAC.1
MRVHRENPPDVVLLLFVHPAVARLHGHVETPRRHDPRLGVLCDRLVLGQGVERRGGLLRHRPAAGRGLYLLGLRLRGLGDPEDDGPEEEVWLLPVRVAFVLPLLRLLPRLLPLPVVAVL